MFPSWIKQAINVNRHVCRLFSSSSSICRITYIYREVHWVHIYVYNLFVYIKQRGHKQVYNVCDLRKCFINQTGIATVELLYHILYTVHYVGNIPGVRLFFLNK